MHTSCKRIWLRMRSISSWKTLLNKVPAQKAKMVDQREQVNLTQIRVAKHQAIKEKQQLNHLPNDEKPKENDNFIINIIFVIQLKNVSII